MLSNNTKCVAVCAAGMDANYNDELFRTMHSMADEFGLKLLFFISFSSLYEFEKHDIGESNIFHLINYRLIDGVIMLTETIKNEKIRRKIIDEANANNVPVISIDHFMEDCYNINFQYANAMKEMIAHLVEHHHCQKINFIAGGKENSFSDDRTQAYRQMLEKYNIPIEEERIGYGNFWGEPTKQVMKDFIESDLPFPDAIVCANDSMAIAAVKCLADAGYRVPEDVAVTGFDGILEGQEHLPKITTARNDYRKAIQYAFQIVLDCLAGEKLESQFFVDAVPMLGSSCGCNQNITIQYNNDLNRKLYDRLAEYDEFNRKQIAMLADLTDSDSFQDVFDNLVKYSDSFFSDKFWLCIVDDFLVQKEAISDIIEESTMNRVAQYSSTMNVMLSKSNGEWLGITDFNTETFVPNLEEVLAEDNNIMFLPLHVLERTIGYVALVYHPEQMKMIYEYQFLMNVSNALETTRIHKRQKTIIDNLEMKYIHDPMTGLLNRRGFYQQLANVYCRCMEENGLLMVVSADLNGLKPINDTYGHADGDIAITAVGKALSEAAFKDFTCARFGGDEFVAAGRVESREDEFLFRKRVEESLDAFNSISGKPYKVSSSIGCFIGVPNEHITLDDFIKAADEKMYEDKVCYHARAQTRPRQSGG